MQQLVERRSEVAGIRTAVEDVMQGRGRTVIVEAIAGLGKTALVDVAVDLALKAGAQVVSTRAHHLGSSTPFGSVRRLLGPEVERRGGASALTGAASFAAPLFVPGATLQQGISYGCLWLALSLAEGRPLCLVVDDAHWADAASLEILLDLATEIQHQPVMIVLATRPAADAAVRDTIDAFPAVPTCITIHLSPLSVTGVASLVRRAYGTGAPHHEFVRTCQELTGGNAFYLQQLLRALVERGVRPDLASTSVVRQIGRDILGRNVNVRLAQLGVDARRLANSAAVLGDGAPLSTIAALADVPTATAVQICERLRAASILANADPVSFPHPLIRSAVEATVPPGGLGPLHAAAARVLREQGAPASQVVSHLMLAPPGSDEVVCRLLHAEAVQSLRSGSIHTAHTLLQRALAEPPTEQFLATVLLELGRVETLLGTAEADKHLQEAADRAPDRRVRAAALTERLPVLHTRGLVEQIPAVFESAFGLFPLAATVEEVRLRWHLVAFSTYPGVPQLPPGLLEPALDKLPATTGEDRNLLVALAQRALLDQADVGEVFRHIRRAVTDLPSGLWSYYETGAVLEAAAHLVWHDELDLAERLCDQAAPHVARGGGPIQQVHLDHRRVRIALQRGEFDEALDMIPHIADRARRGGVAAYERRSRRYRGEVLLEQGDLVLAGEELAKAPEVPFDAALAALLVGRLEAARHLILQAHQGPLRREYPTMLVASHIYQQLGDRDEAVAAAEEEVETQRELGRPSMVALALRRRASLAGPAESATLLLEAFEQAGRGPRRHVRARVAADLGAALRRSGHVKAAREHLASAVDLALQMRMTSVLRKATEELLLAGGRPRRDRVTGVSALTPSQLRAARLAVRGLGNRAIAEELVLTIKTVESHLAAAYRKLGITSRDELASRLGATE